MNNIKPNYKSYCELCEGYVTICGKCGNNTCNGGYGEINGEKCDQCPSAYAEDKSANLELNTKINS